MAGELVLSVPVHELAAAISAQVAVLLAVERTSPWMTKDEAVDYTRLPRGTFEKLSANGSIPSHGGRSKLYHRDELDRALMTLEGV